MQLHAEVPLLTLARLVHLGIAGLVGVLRRAGCAPMMVASTMVRCRSFSPSGLQNLSRRRRTAARPDRDLELAAKLPAAVEPSGNGKLQQFRSRRPRSEAQRCCQQRHIARLVGQVEPVLHEVHARARHTESTGGRPLPGRVVRLDQRHSASHGTIVHRRTGTRRAWWPGDTVRIPSPLVGRQRPGSVASSPLQRLGTRRMVAICSSVALSRVGAGIVIPESILACPRTRTLFSSCGSAFGSWALFLPEELFQPHTHAKRWRLSSSRM